MSSEAQSSGSPRPATLPASSRSGAALPLALSAAVLIGIAFGGWKWYQVHQFEIAKSEAIPADAIGPPLKDFELTERSGKPFKSTGMRGKVWVASYFFTNCPGQCLRLNANVQVLANEPDLKDVTWVSITCDPDNDTVEALRAYADRWKADPNRWLFCRGDLEYIQRIAKGMKIFLSLKGHQDYLIVIDKAGNIRKILDGTSEIECNRLHKVLLECLDEKAPDEAPANAETGSEKRSDKPVAEKPAVEKTPNSKPAASAERENGLTILAAAHPIVHVNAALNTLATVLLLLGLYFIRRGRIEAHKRTMLAAFAVSIAFLVCYLYYHTQVGSVRFTHPGLVRYVYLAILASHVLLAATVPFLAVRQIYLGFRALGCCDAKLPALEQAAVAALYREKHVQLAKWTFPIWLYVSVTGVVVYVMLYHLWPPAGL